MWSEKIINFRQKKSDSSYMGLGKWAGKEINNNETPKEKLLPLIG